jgi:hypothetical protein
MRTSRGLVTGICAAIGKGRIIWSSACINRLRVHTNTGSARNLEDGTNPKIKPPFYAADILRGSVGKILEHVVQNPLLNTSGLPEGWLTTCYTSSNGGNFIVHLINADGILAKDPGIQISHDDIIQSFSECPSGNWNADQAILRIRWDDRKRVRRVSLHTPERAEALGLEWSLCSGWLEVKLNSNSFRGYGIIDTELL